MIQHFNENFNYNFFTELRVKSGEWRWALNNNITAKDGKNMKLIHTADWHLGKIIFSRSMLELQAEFTDNFLKPLILSEKPDALVLAGDIFDRSIAPTEAIKMLDDFIGFMSEAKIPLLAITGNHDGRERITLGASILKQSGIHIATDIKDAFEPVVLEKDGEKYCFYLIPHFDPPSAREFFGDDSIKSFGDSYKALTDKLYEQLDDKCVSIAVSHCFMSGCTVSDSESPVYIGASGEVSGELFKGFDLTLLGHLHSPQQAGENGYYSGSPLKYSFGEQNSQKGVNIFELENGAISRRFEEFKPSLDMRVISGEFEKLMEDGKANPSDDFIHIHLTDKKPIFMPLQRLREFYPNILEMSSELISAPGELLSTPSKRSFGDPVELFREFSKQICGIDADSEEIELFRKIAEEALG